VDEFRFVITYYFGGLWKDAKYIDVITRFFFLVDIFKHVASICFEFQIHSNIISITFTF